MSKPVVAIVGRPNVGKSTLFNRLVQDRWAIVEETPGVTRDRIYRTVEWNDRSFVLVDTGGIDFGESDLIATQVKKQAELAVAEADLLLFVVDGKTGITPQDKEVAQILRKAQKPVLVVVNKLDNNLDSKEIYEFYELGFEKLFPSSALHGIGTGDLLDEVVKLLPEKTEAEEPAIIKIAVVGRPNVGKSSLVNRIIGTERVIVSDIAGTTRDAVDTPLIWKGQHYLLVDTAGIRRRPKIAESVEYYSVLRAMRVIEQSDIVILVVDANEPATVQDQKIVGYAHDAGKGIIIAVNKWDTIKKDSQTYLEYEKEVRNHFAYLLYAPLIFISAKTGQRVPELMDLVQYVSEQQNRRVPTAELNRVLEEAVLRHAPPTYKDKRLKIKYITQVGVKPPTFALFVNDRNLMHFSYERYLENQLRTAFGFEGTPIVFKLNEKDRRKK
ncbi:MAG: ribosome biogenesis GTPase Der [Firmicutes bacterium]|nr:ribosome biogenesis GTPase Der [Bacillota bacterium]